MNKERLRMVLDVMRTHPEQVDMCDWIIVQEDGEDRPLVYHEDAGRLSNCGTTGCIAGWACSLFPGEADPDEEIPVAAEKILGLDDEMLFYQTQWDTPDKVFEGLEHFIETGEL